MWLGELKCLILPLVVFSVDKFTGCLGSNFWFAICARVVDAEVRTVGRCVSGIELGCPVDNCQEFVRCPLNLGLGVLLVLSYGEGGVGSWATIPVHILVLLRFWPICVGACRRRAGRFCLNLSYCGFWYRRWVDATLEGGIRVAAGVCWRLPRGNLVHMWVSLILFVGVFCFVR